MPLKAGFQRVMWVTVMRHFLLPLLLLAASLGALAAPQDARPPLSKDEVLDLLTSSAPDKVIISTVKQYGIAFQPTPQVLEEFRKAGADKALLAALQQAWHAEVTKPLTEKEILVMQAENTPDEKIVRVIEERGIDFQENEEYLEHLRSLGANDVLINVLRTAVPKPFSKDELVQLLTARVDQEWIAQKVQLRFIDFAPTDANLQALRNAGARAPLLETIRTAQRAKPLVAKTPAGPAGPTAPSGPKLADPLVEGKTVTLLCDPTDPDVPVFSEPGNLGKIATHLRCGEKVTFLGRVIAPPGVDQIKYADGKEGFVANSFLEPAIVTPGGDVTLPSAIYKPDAKYTPEARRDRIEGVVKLSIVVDVQGNVSDVRETSEPLGEGLDQSAIDTVKTWRFTPATRNGVPIAVRVNVQISFRLYQDTP